MIGLANFIAEHRGAVEHDLLTETGYELGDIGGDLSWGALKSFVSNIKLGSALGEELNPELTRWATPAKTNYILADICDQLSLVNYYLYALVTKKRGKKLEPYKRPGDDKKETRRIGRGALPPDQMREWIKNRRR